MIAAILLIASVAIRVDQVGYPTHGPKIATIYGDVKSVTVSGRSVPLSAPIFDRDSGEELRTADLSFIDKPGTYRLEADGDHADVVVADDPHADVLQLAMRAYTGQRCGTAVNIGGGYAHPACHLDSPVKGGWHDAGDYGRYVVNSGITTGTLLLACELFAPPVMPNREDGEEPGRGTNRGSQSASRPGASRSAALGMTSDSFLDEIRWNVDWMFGMQDRDGSVFHKETSKEFPPFIAPQDDHSPQLLIGKSSCATGDFAAIMAMAARAYNEPRYEAAAKRAWTWLQSHPNITFRNPPDIKTGEYGDRDCSDERLWAAAELWRTSGDADARAYFVAHKGEALRAIESGKPPDWQHVGALAAWTIALWQHDTELTQRTIDAANAIVERARAHPYRIPMLTRDYVWGSNAVAANYGVELLVANALRPNRAYVDTSIEILHYLLGRNPFSMSWVTGTGTTSPMHPHHRPSATDNIVAPWPGLLAGGPNRHRQDPAMRKIAANTPPARMYVDDQESYASNEVAINWNAPLVFVLAGVRDRPRVALFRARDFPTVDARAIPPATLDRALSSVDVHVVDDLHQLDANDRLLVLPYGSAFPLDGWPAVRDFIKRGGNLAILGGAPLHQPVLRTATGWQLGTRQPTFAHEFLFGPAEAVRATGTVALPNTAWQLPIHGAHTVWEMTIRLGTKPDNAAEWGAEAPHDGVVRPLVQIVDADGIPRACPLLEIDHLRGDYAGARWIFAPSDAPLDEQTIRAIVMRASQGASELDARPVNASVEAGEAPQIRIRGATSGDVIVRDDNGAQLERTSFDGAVVTLAPRPAGLYHVEVRANGMTTKTGFWSRDTALLARSPKMTVSRDWMRRDGKVFPVTGTTYMASDVHRQFLFEPNPDVWDRDFAAMQRAGINFVRTGLWTGWAKTSSESFARALDAYVQTAAKHDIVVCFTFYAFQPDAYGGANPFLDPKSIDGQKKFVSIIASRYRGSGWIQYDLINEPSYAPPSGLWSNRPMRDDFERRAWTDWVHARYGNDETKLRDVWQDASDSLLDVARDDEIWPAQVREERHPRKVADFVLFTNDVIARWAATLRDAIRAAAGADALVTLGQDEGGTGTRPSQLLHASSIDYTSIHPWWQNEDVLANGIAAKVVDKPMLFQETGMMREEDAGGFPVRTPEENAALLERKFAYAFMARGTGAVEWAWNINPYMPIDNESTIGLFRPDGTAKPEFDVVRNFAKFFRDAAPQLDDYAPDPVVIKFPQSRLFLNRTDAMDKYRHIVRVLAERYGIVPTAVSDLRPLPAAKLVIDPVTVDESALAKTLADAGVETITGHDGLLVRVLHAPHASLTILINETSHDIEYAPLHVVVRAGRSELRVIPSVARNPGGGAAPSTRPGSSLRSE